MGLDDVCPDINDAAGLAFASPDAKSRLRPGDCGCPPLPGRYSLAGSACLSVSHLVLAGFALATLSGPPSQWARRAVALKISHGRPSRQPSASFNAVESLFAWKSRSSRTYPPS